MTATEPRCDYCGKPVTDSPFVAFDDTLMHEVHKRIRDVNAPARGPFVFCTPLCCARYSLHLGAAAATGANNRFSMVKPTADAPRAHHELYALVYGFFWTACPNCGRMFGGHEEPTGVWWTHPGGGKCTCPECPGNYNVEARDCTDPACHYVPCVEKREAQAQLERTSREGATYAKTPEQLAREIGLDAAAVDRIADGLPEGISGAYVTNLDGKGVLIEKDPRPPIVMEPPTPAGELQILPAAVDLDYRPRCAGGCGRAAIDGKRTCGEVKCGRGTPP